MFKLKSALFNSFFFKLCTVQKKIGIPFPFYQTILLSQSGFLLPMVKSANLRLENSKSTVEV